jgi:ABC-type dipeptide/oligopeptide/nickel transport system ATPase component
MEHGPAAEVFAAPAAAYTRELMAAAFLDRARDAAPPQATGEQLRNP